jgi:hypothetical protein
MNSITWEDGRYGRRAVITSSWSDEMASYLMDEHVSELELNDAKGWHGNDLGFLTTLRQLQALKIIDLKLQSIEPIHVLQSLRSLEVITYCASEIRFSMFPWLEDCGLEWRPRAASLFSCTTLKSLFLNGYDGKDTNPFGQLRKLESLALLNAPIEDLRGLAVLENLRSLRLANLGCLKSLAGVEKLIGLEELEIHTCRGIRSIEEIGYLCRLRQLHLNNDGKIMSLKPLARLTDLEAISFYETTNIVDGDLSPLLCQSNLSRVSFQNRRHYSHRREEFNPAYRG